MSTKPVVKISEFTIIFNDRVFLLKKVNLTGSWKWYVFVPSFKEDISFHKATFGREGFSSSREVVKKLEDYISSRTRRKEQ